VYADRAEYEVKAIVIEETGGPEQLQLHDVPDPDVYEGQSLIHVRAAGVNFLDILVRRGNYAQAPELPTIPGVEVAGETEDGRRVMGLLTGGGYAERVAVEEERLFPLPDGASFAEGASFLLTFLTAWIPLTRQVRLEPGQTVLVHAGSGGVGTAAIQVARHLGARVMATASTEEKRRFCVDLGADDAYGYDEFADTVRPDLVVDPVGGEVFAASVAILSPLGTIVPIGYAGGWWQELNPALLVGRNVGVQGFYLGRLMARRSDVVAAAAAELLDLWGSGAFKPVVGKEFPLAEAAEAHRLIEDRNHVGKVVLVP
jgi:NADPH:quinone reductase